MSYIDQTSRRRPATIAAVTLVHLGIGYAIVSGLAYTVISSIPHITIANNYVDPPAPPTHELPPSQRATHDASLQPAQPTIVPTQSFGVQSVDILPPEPPAGPTVDTRPTEPQPNPPKADLTRAAQAGTGRISWVTTDDYPPQPLRDGISGVVAISVQIGTDGRVQNCTVTKSSGNAQLDDTTCRLYARRAHFQPALDADGKPVASVKTDRIRWQLPAE